MSEKAPRRSRIEPLAPSELDAEFRAMVEAAREKGHGEDLAAVMGRLPDLFRSYFRFFYPAHEGGVVPARIKELARLKIARLNDCPT